MINIYKEYDRKYAADPVKFPFAIESSKLREASEEEINAARKEYAENNYCDHSFVIDTDGWLYDLRECAICGCGLGMV